jgi:regulator of replication initiation timing
MEKMIVLNTYKDMRVKVVVYVNNQSSSVVTYLPVNIGESRYKDELASWLQLAQKTLLIAAYKNKQMPYDEIEKLQTKLDDTKAERGAVYDLLIKSNKQLDDLKAELKQMGDYADELFADCATFLNERDALRKQLDTTIYEAKLANEAFATIEKQDTELRKQLDIAIEYIKDDLYTDKSYEAVEILKKLEG